MNRTGADKRELELSLSNLTAILEKYPDQSCYITEEWLKIIQLKLSNLTVVRERAYNKAVELGIY